MSKPITYLGNRAAETTRGALLTCRPCGVSWTGCAAECECPRCGEAQAWWPTELAELFADLQAQVDAEAARQRAIAR